MNQLFSGAFYGIFPIVILDLFLRLFCGRLPGSGGWSCLRGLGFLGLARHSGRSGVHLSRRITRGLTILLRLGLLAGGGGGSSVLLLVLVLLAVADDGGATLALLVVISRGCRDQARSDHGCALRLSFLLFLQLRLREPLALCLKPGFLLLSSALFLVRGGLLRVSDSLGCGFLRLELGLCLSLQSFKLSFLFMLLFLLLRNLGLHGIGKSALSLLTLLCLGAFGRGARTLRAFEGRPHTGTRSLRVPSCSTSCRRSLPFLLLLLLELLDLAFGEAGILALLTFILFFHCIGC